MHGTKTGLFTIGPKKMNAVHTFIQHHSIPGEPFPVTQQTVNPVHFLRTFLRIGQAELIILRRQFTGTGVPQIVKLTDQPCPDAQLSPLFQQWSKRQDVVGLSSCPSSPNRA